MQLVSPAEQRPQCCFSSPHYDEASRAWRTGGGALFLPNCIRFVRKRHWPSRLWNDLLIPRGDTSICGDAVDTFSCQNRQHQPLCRSLLGGDKNKKKTESEEENQSNDCSKRHWYLTNEGLSGNGDAGTHRARFHWVDFEIYRLFCSNDCKLDQRKGSDWRESCPARAWDRIMAGSALSLVQKRCL